MANIWGAFRNRITPSKVERRNEIRYALVAYLDDGLIVDKDRGALIRLKYIDGPSGMVTRMGHEFLEYEEKMDRYMAQYWPEAVL